MKKIFYFLLAGGMFLSSCELEDDGTENGGGSNNNDGGGNNNNSEAGLVESFTVKLAYNSLTSSEKASFDLHNLTAVAANSSEADITLCYQNNYKYAMVTPNSSWLKDLYAFNDKSYSNSNSTTICNLGQVPLSDYDEASELKSLSVSSGSISYLAGKDQVQVNDGDVIAFQKGNIKGVGQITGLSMSVSKVKANATFKGYVYNPSAAK